MKKEKDSDFIQALRDNGLQVTSQRLAILKALHHHVEEHPSAEVIHRHVCKQFPNMSLRTVSRALEKFHEVGLIHRFSPVTDLTRYEAASGQDHHLVCIKCQAVRDVEDPSDESRLTLPEGNGFHVLAHQVIFHGYCPACITPPVPWKLVRK